MDPVVVVALIGFPPTFLASWAAWRNASAANRAVNHQGRNEPKLIEKIDQINRRVGRIDKRVEDIDERVASLEQR